MFCQERHPELYDLGGAELVRPEIGGVLPVFVLDRYEGLEARLLPDLTPEERERYVELNAAALRERLPADVVFANHVAARRAGRRGDRARVSRQGARLGARVLDARQRGAVGVGARVARARGRPCSSARRTSARCSRTSSVTSTASYEVPPGVDVDEFVPLPRDEALARLLDEARRDPPNPGNANERLPDEGNAERLRGVLRAARSRPSSTSAS